MQTINKIISANEKINDVLMNQSGLLDVVVYENASYDLNLLQAGQSLKVKVSLLGQNACCTLRTVYLSGTDADNKIEFEVIHAVEQTNSKQEIKGVAAGFGKADFYGVIRMPHGSQKCEGSQSHKALLLSDNACIKCTPELEIYADDVKCAHGSSIGTLDETYLFYLMSRGIDETTARQMLIKAFLLSDMPQAFETEIDKWMEANE
ncbi:MAG: SufD family Fe-S cluster assembly protein [Alphaproteobacteria bacterium]|nr:SufD family Fe-S cluster assembly protein [Alphaproteobacteria bacterium]